MNYSGHILKALEEFGQEAHELPKAWSPRYGPPAGFVPDAVVIDADAGRRGFYLAGFYRGRGVPVVYVYHPGGELERRFASRTGAITLPGVDAFRSWLSTSPDYLRRDKP